MITQYEAMRHGYAYVDLSRVTLDPHVIALVSAESARRLAVVPVKQDGNNLWVCMEMPPTPRVLERVALETGCRVIPVAVISKALEITIDFYYPLPS
jgi:hypothetical protein